MPEIIHNHTTFYILYNHYEITEQKPILIISLKCSIMRGDCCKISVLPKMTLMKVTLPEKKPVSIACCSVMKKIKLSKKPDM